MLCLLFYTSDFSCVDTLFHIYICFFVKYSGYLNIGLAGYPNTCVRLPNGKDWEWHLNTGQKI